MKKILIIAVVALVAGGVAAKMFLMPKPAEPKMKVEGIIVALPEFVINLSDGGFAKLKVALEIDHLDPAVAELAAAGGHGGGGGKEFHLPQEAIIREIVLEDVNAATSRDLISRAGKDRLRKDILKDIKKRSDHKVHDVIFSDVVVDTAGN
jgi:flagellar FliL protein